MRSRNQTLISQLFGENANNVFYLDGTKNSAVQITEKARACQKSNVFPLYVYMHDLQEIMITPALLNFIKQLRYSIIGFERISLKLLKSIFENLPDTAKRIGLDWMLSEEGFKIIHSAIVLRKQSGQHIEVICGKSVCGVAALTDLSKSILTSPLILPTSPALDTSAVDIVQAHLAMTHRVREELQREDLRHNLRRYKTKTTNPTAAVVVQPNSGLEEFKSELNASRKRRKKNPKPQASTTSTISELKPVDSLPNIAPAPVNISAPPSRPFFFKPTALLHGKPYIPAVNSRVGALPEGVLTSAPSSILPIAPVAPVVPVTTMISSLSSPTTSTYPRTQDLLSIQASSLQSFLNSSSLLGHANSSFLNNSSLLGYANPSAGGLFSYTAPSTFSQPTPTMNSLPQQPYPPLPDLQALLRSQYPSQRMI